MFYGLLCLFFQGCKTDGCKAQSYRGGTGVFHLLTLTDCLLFTFYKQVRDVCAVP